MIRDDLSPGKDVPTPVVPFGAYGKEYKFYGVEVIIFKLRMIGQGIKMGLKADI